MVVLLFVFTGCQEKPTITESSKSVKIGILAPLSGTHKVLGVQGLYGIEAAREMSMYLNNGDKVIFKIVDTLSTEEGSKVAFKKLIDSNVTAVISFMGSGRTLALRNEFEKAKTPVIATLATDNEIVNMSEYIAQICMDNTTQTIVAAHYIRDEKLMEGVGIVYSSDSQYFSLLAKDFKKYFKQIGGEIDFYIDISTPAGLEEFKNIKTISTEMLFNASKNELTPKIINILKKKKSKIGILGVNGSYNNGLHNVKANRVKYDNFYIVEHYADDIDKSEKREVFENSLEHNNLQESSYAYLSYDGYQLLRKALNQCLKYDKECIKSVFQNSVVIEGLSGNFSMINAKAKREIYIDRIKNNMLKKEVIVY